MRVGKWRSIRC